MNDHPDWIVPAEMDDRWVVPAEADKQEDPPEHWSIPLVYAVPISAALWAGIAWGLAWIWRMFH
jgi:hypothetical protein